MDQLSVLYLCPLSKQHQQWRLAAAPAGLNVTMRRFPSRDEIIGLIAQADVLISERAGVIDREIIEAGTRLKLIQRVGTLYYDIDLAAARERGIAVATTPIYSVIAVAEQMMMQIMAVLRRVFPLQPVVRTPPERFTVSAPLGPGDVPTEIPFTPRRTNEDVFAFNWSRETRVGLLYGKTVGILGFGEIGAELSRRLANWHCRILYSKRTRLPAETEQHLGIDYRAQEDLLRESDIVICLLPYFPETDQWLNAKRIAMMKPGAILCEAGSGSVVDEQAVADALHSGHLGGAAFDTYEWEPIKQDNPLLTLANSNPLLNIVLTPHIGSCNDRADSGYGDFYRNAVNLLHGQPISNSL
ncbi:MAG TPA: NAD(P)-dependent oxidoreductase [Anaerolineae bacterium]|jgi:phosphoglycerate dehydrogenase-like enzyme